MVYSLKMKWVYWKHHIICNIMHTVCRNRIFMQPEARLAPVYAALPAAKPPAPRRQAAASALVPDFQRVAKRAVSHSETGSIGGRNGPFRIAKRPPLAGCAVATGLPGAFHLIILYASGMANAMLASLERAAMKPLLPAGYSMKGLPCTKKRQPAKGCLLEKGLVCVILRV